MKRFPVTIGGGKGMKQPIKIVKDMVEKYPNDMELGARIRWYIRWLYEGKEDKEYKDDKKWSP